MDREEALRIVRAVENGAQGPEPARLDVRRPHLAGEDADGYERIYQTIDCELISEADYLAAQDLLKSKGGKPPKYDWKLVVALAIHEVRDDYYHDRPMPTAAELTHMVADRYADLKHVYLDEGQNGDLRRWCAAVIKGFTE